MRLIGSWLLSQLSVAKSIVSLAMWFTLGGDASLVVGVVAVRVVTETGYRGHCRTNARADRSFCRVDARAAFVGIR